VAVTEEAFKISAKGDRRDLPIVGSCWRFANLQLDGDARSQVAEELAPAAAATSAKLDRRTVTLGGGVDPGEFVSRRREVGFQEKSTYYGAVTPQLPSFGRENSRQDCTKGNSARFAKCQQCRTAN
jgi:hypothetical protein